MIAVYTFTGALIALCILFALKFWEVGSGRILFPRFRALLDRGASALKRFLIVVADRVALIPPFVARIVRILFASFALYVARLARATAEAAHRVADVVSYKHRFERRETRSEFLKKVSEHKEGASGEKDTPPL